MPLRIRKEVQEELKASLEAAPKTVSAVASEEGEAPASPASDASSPAAAVPKKPRRKAPKTPKSVPRAPARGRRAPIAARQSKPRRAQGHPANGGTLPALYKPNFRTEMAQVRDMFAFLRERSHERAQLEALEKVTIQYLRKDPSLRKFKQVMKLLEKQVLELMERDLAAYQLEAKVIVLPAEPVAPAASAPTEPAPAPAKPESEAKTPAPEPRRRRIAAWFRRKGGAGGSGSDGSGERLNFLKGIRLRTAMMACIWLGVGGATLTYAAALFHVNFMRLETDTAMIAGTVEPVNAPMDGSVVTLLVRTGDRISEGQRIAVLEDPEVEKQVRLASVKVERAREDLRLKQAEFEAERQKRDEYVLISRSKIEKIDEDIAALESQERVARERFDRLSDLFKKGIVIRPRVEEASDKLAELSAQLSKARINRRERMEQADNVLAGHFYDGSQVVGRMKETEAAMNRASAEVDLALEELRVMQQRRHVNRITAARDSRVMKVLRPEGSAVKKGDTILIMEATESRVVHAFVRQEDASRIALGDDATVFLPALRAKATARVAAVDRNAAFIDDVDARYTWKQARDGGPKPTDRDRTARITLRFDGADREIVDRKFEIGMPTVVSFPRRSISTVFSSFTEVGSRL